MRGSACFRFVEGLIVHLFRLTQKSIPNHKGYAN